MSIVVKATGKLIEKQSKIFVGEKQTAKIVFVIETLDQQYPTLLQVDAMNERSIDEIESYSVGDVLECELLLGSKKHGERYFTNLGVRSIKRS